MDWNAAGAVAGTLLAACGLVAVVIKSWLLPYLRDELVHPVQQTHAQLTVNHHVSDPPTIRDQLDTMRDQLDENTTETRAVARMFDGHLDWSQREVDRLWAALERVRDHHAPTHRRNDDQIG